ncbi:MAG: SCO family protein [Chitinophagales bacterium]
MWTLSACNSEKKETLPFYNDASFTPVFLTTKQAEAEITHTITPFSCTDQNGVNITLSDVANKIHVANFFYTTCNSICPVMNSKLASVVNTFAEDSDIVFLSFSVTPWMDSVEALQMYAMHAGSNNPRWHFLTGETQQIYDLARNGYFAEELEGMTKDSSDFVHTEHVLLVDKAGRIRGIYNGTLDTEMQQLEKDIRTLKKN